MAEFGTNTEEDLQVLDAKMKGLRLDYEQYFLGSRPRPPSQLRSEVQKMISLYANVPIQNTALRFKFNNLRARFFSYRRHWDDTLRKIEEGSYERHVFKADLHDRERRRGRATPEEAAAGRGKGKRAAAAEEGAADPLFAAYVAARENCGQGAKGLSAEAFQRMLKTQEAAIKDRYACESVRFRVVVEAGRAKLKASPVKPGRT